MSLQISTEDERVAKQIMEASRSYQGTFLVRYGKAAKAIAKVDYSQLPEGVKSYISSVGGKVSAITKAKKKEKETKKINKVVTKKPKTKKQLHTEAEAYRNASRGS